MDSNTHAHTVGSTANTWCASQNQHHCSRHTTPCALRSPSVCLKTNTRPWVSDENKGSSTETILFETQISMGSQIQFCVFQTKRMFQTQQCVCITINMCISIVDIRVENDRNTRRNSCWKSTSAGHTHFHRRHHIGDEPRRHNTSTMHTHTHKTNTRNIANTDIDVPSAQTVPATHRFERPTAGDGESHAATRPPTKARKFTGAHTDWKICPLTSRPVYTQPAFALDS